LLFQPNQLQPEAPPLSDVPLRPAISHLAGNTVEVAMADKPPAPPSFERKEPPIRILITRRGMRETVRDLQVLLNALGHDAGAPDGHNGTATRAAILSFQTAEGLPAAGEITLELVEAIFRKAGRGTPPNGILRVRQAFQPLFEADVTIDKPEVALGTHFLQFQDLDAETGEGNWFGLSLDNALTNATKKRLGIETDADALAFNTLQRTLARITVPEDVRGRIAALLANGSSLSIADTDMGLETGEGTDFITITQTVSGG
jgi:peptidoglycan hydrolase-like protein with peptidoglycan-binding domain